MQVASLSPYAVVCVVWFVVVVVVVCVCVCVGGGVRVRQAVFLSLSHHNEGDSLPDHQLVPGDTTINHLRLPQPTNKSRADNVIIHVYTSATEHAMHVRSRACTLATHTRTHARTHAVRVCIARVSSEHSCCSALLCWCYFTHQQVHL
jgi:hypothetical protein